MTAAADKRTSEHAERRAAASSDPKPHIIDVLSATMVFSAMKDAATTKQEINIK